jgi:hypothetical protein
MYRTNRWDIGEITNLACLGNGHIVFDWITNDHP